MSVRTLIEKGSVRAMLRALIAWITSALPLCFLSACVIRAHGLGSAQIGVCSSILSFLCAFAAGAVGTRGGRLGQGLLCGAFLCLVLLTCGFLISGNGMDPSGVLSVVSFSFAGCAAGSLLTGGKKAATKQSGFQKKKKQK